MKIFLLQWTEYEAGWGNRPDGYTFYQTLDAARSHIKDMESNKEYSCFSAPSWDSLKEMEVTEDITFPNGEDCMWVNNADVSGSVTISNNNGIIKETKTPPVYKMQPTGISMSLRHLLEQA